MKKSITLVLAFVFASLMCAGVSFARNTKNTQKTSNAKSPLNRKITIHVDEVSFPTFLNAVTEKSKIEFLTMGTFQTKSVTVHLSNITVKEILDFAFAEQGLNYQLIDGSETVLIRKPGQGSDVLAPKDIKEETTEEEPEKEIKEEPLKENKKEETKTIEKEEVKEAQSQEEDSQSFAEAAAITQQVNTLLDKRITVKVKDAPIRTLTNSLKIHAKNKIDFIASPDIREKKITLNADNISLQEILEYVSDEYNLKYRREGTNIYIDAK